MKPLLIGECLLPHITRVLEGERPGVPLPEHAIFAVFSEPIEEGAFCGLATADDIAKHPNWTFADLTHSRQLHSIEPDADVHQALGLMGKEANDILSVLNAGNAFVGVVTRQSIQHALLMRVHTLLQESQRLNQLVDDERKKMLDWSTLLAQLHDASRALLSVLAHTSLETSMHTSGGEFHSMHDLLKFLAKVAEGRPFARPTVVESGRLV